MSSKPFIPSNGLTVQRQIHALLAERDPTYRPSEVKPGVDVLASLREVDGLIGQEARDMPSIRPLPKAVPEAPPAPPDAPLAPASPAPGTVQGAIAGLLPPLPPPKPAAPPPSAVPSVGPKTPLTADEEEWRKIRLIMQQMADQPAYRELMEEAYADNKLSADGRRRYEKAIELFDGAVDIDGVEPAEVQARVNLARIADVRVSNAPHDYRVHVTVSPSGVPLINLGASRDILEQRFYHQWLADNKVDFLSSTPQQREEAVQWARLQAGRSIASVAAAGRGVVYVPDKSQPEIVKGFTDLPLGISGAVAMLSPQRMLKGQDVIAPDSDHMEREGTWSYLFDSVSLGHYAAAGVRTLREMAGWTDPEVPLPIALSAGMIGTSGLLDLVEERHIQHVMDRTKLHEEAAEWAALPTYFYARLIEGVSHEEANLARDATASSALLQMGMAAGYFFDVDFLTAVTFGGAKVGKVAYDGYNVWKAGDRVRKIDALADKIDHLADTSASLTSAMGELERSDPEAYMLLRQQMIADMAARSEEAIDVRKIDELNRDAPQTKAQSDARVAAYQQTLDELNNAGHVDPPDASQIDPLKLAKRLRRRETRLDDLKEIEKNVSSTTAAFDAQVAAHVSAVADHARAGQTFADLRKQLDAGDVAAMDRGRALRIQVAALEDALKTQAEALKFNGSFTAKARRHAALKAELNALYNAHPKVRPTLRAERAFGEATAKLYDTQKVLPADPVAYKALREATQRKVVAAREAQEKLVEASRKQWHDVYVHYTVHDSALLDRVAAAMKIERKALRAMGGKGTAERAANAAKKASAVKGIAAERQAMLTLESATNWRASMKNTASLFRQGMRTAKEKGTMPRYWSKNHAATTRVSEQTIHVNTDTLDVTAGSDALQQQIHESLIAQGVPTSELPGMAAVLTKLRALGTEASTALADYIETGIKPLPDWRPNMALLQGVLDDLTGSLAAKIHMPENLAIAYIMGKMDGKNGVPKPFRWLRDYVHKIAQDPTMGRTGRMHAAGQQAVRYAENSINRTMEELAHVARAAYKGGADQIVPTLIKYMDNTDAFETAIGPTVMNNIGGESLFISAKTEILNRWKDGGVHTDPVLDGLARIWTTGLSPEQAESFRKMTVLTLSESPDFATWLGLMRERTVALRGSGNVDMREGRVVTLAARGLAQAVGIKVARHVLESADLPLSAERAKDMTRILNTPANAFRFHDFNRALQDVVKWEMPITQRTEDVALGPLAKKQVDKTPVQLTEDSYVPGTILDAITESMDGAVKEFDMFHPEAANTVTQRASRALGTLWNMYKMDMVTGVVLPKPQYFTYAALGDMGQMWFTRGTMAAFRMAPYQMLTYMPGGGKILAKLGKKNLPLLGAIIDPDCARVLSPTTNPDDVVTLGGKDYKVRDLRRQAAIRGVTDSMAERTVQTEISRMASMMLTRNKGQRALERTKATMNYLGREANYLATMTQHRTRMAFFLQELRNGASLDDAAKATNEALFDWAHGVSRASVFTQLGAVPFYRWWHLAHRFVGTQLAHFAQRPTLTNGPWQKIHVFSTLYNELLPGALRDAMGEEDFDEFDAYARAWAPDYTKGSRPGLLPVGLDDGKRQVIDERNPGTHYSHLTGILPGMTQLDVAGLALVPVMGMLAMLAEAMGEGTVASNIYAQMLDPFADNLAPQLKPIYEAMTEGTIHPDGYTGKSGLISVSESQAWVAKGITGGQYNPLGGAPDYLRNPDTQRPQLTTTEYALLQALPVVGMTLPRLLDTMYYKNPYTRDEMGKMAAFFLTNWLGLAKTTLYNPSNEHRRAIREMEFWIHKEETRTTEELQKASRISR